MTDPWAGFARGEDHEFREPVQARFDTYRGMFWVWIQIGVWWVPAVIAMGAVLVVASLVNQWAPVAVALGIGWVVFVLAADQATPGWAEDHNERVRGALLRERAVVAQAQADDLSWRVPPVRDDAVDPAGSTSR